MFTAWKQEKTTAALVTEAQDLADKLTDAKPHVVEAYAAAAQFWAVSYLADGQVLQDLTTWKPDAIKRFVSATETRIAALRKKREYDSSDGLAVWLHTARAVAEPRIAPAIRTIWDRLSDTGTNADIMAQDMLQDAGLATTDGRITPTGFGPGT